MSVFSDSTQTPETEDAAKQATRRADIAAKTRALFEGSTDTPLDSKTIASPLADAAAPDTDASPRSQTREPNTGKQADADKTSEAHAQETVGAPAEHDAHATSEGTGERSELGQQGELNETGPQDTQSEIGPLGQQGEFNETGEQDELDDDDPANHSMPLLDHLGELRRRMLRAFTAILLGFFGCYAIAEPLFNEMIRPLQTVMPANAHMIYTGLPVMFFLHMKLALLASLFVVSPYLFYQIWAFIAPGLYQHERKYIIPLALVSALFFILGASFCYLVVLPFAFTFFLSYSNELVVAMPDVAVYFSFVLKLILAFGLIFEMPLFALFLARLGVLTAAAMRRTRKYAILGIFIIAAILTPPDVMSQTLMALPMLVLYEISILVAAACGRKAKTESPPTPAHNAGSADTTEGDRA